MTPGGRENNGMGRNGRKPKALIVFPPQWSAMTPH